MEEIIIEDIDNTEINDCIMIKVNGSTEHINIKDALSILNNIHYQLCLLYQEKISDERFKRRTG